MKKHKKLVIALIVIILIVVIAVIFIIKKEKANSFDKMPENTGSFMKQDMKNELDESIKQFTNKTDKQYKKTTTLKTQTEIKSALTEKVELHATYYLEEIYVEKNDFVASGENILKYTNGTYLVAPYDCYIIDLNLPDLEGKALNSHYIEISSSNSLMVTMSVDEANIQDISIGMEATIEVNSLNKTYKGYIAHVASTGSNGKFQIEIEFENDGDIKIGMTGEISVII